MARQKYAQGEQSPSALTLEAFEALLSGTRAVYEVGLGDLPVWKILGGDLEACEKYLLAALQDSHEVLLPSLEHRLQQLLDALLSPARRLNVRDLPSLANINDGAHPVWLSFVDSQWHRPDDPEGLLRLEVDTIDDQILAAVALWQLAVARRDPLVFGLEWLLVGLSFGTVAVHLSEPIQSYVLQLVRQTAQRLDEELKRKWPELPGFERRWLEVIDGRSMFARYLLRA